MVAETEPSVLFMDAAAALWKRTAAMFPLQELCPGAWKLWRNISTAGTNLEMKFPHYFTPRSSCGGVTTL